MQYKCDQGVCDVYYVLPFCYQHPKIDAMSAQKYTTKDLLFTVDSEKCDEDIDCLELLISEYDLNLN